MNNKEKDMIFCSWSGGKDCCFALYYALKNDKKLNRLLTMLVKSGKRSRSHGLSIELLEKQADALQAPLVSVPTTWGNYRENFLKRLKEFKNDGITAGIFGDIDIEEHREWVRNVCDDAGIEAYHPLWQKDRRQVLTEFIDLGFKAEIVMVRREKLNKNYLGKTLTRGLLNEFEELGIDICGENGEYHTVVTDGPIFKSPIEVIKREQIKSKDCWFQDLEVK